MKEHRVGQLAFGSSGVGAPLRNGNAGDDGEGRPGNGTDPAGADRRYRLTRVSVAQSRAESGDEDSLSKRCVMHRHLEHHRLDHAAVLTHCESECESEGKADKDKGLDRNESLPRGHLQSLAQKSRHDDNDRDRAGEPPCDASDVRQVPAGEHAAYKRDGDLSHVEDEHVERRRPRVAVREDTWDDELARERDEAERRDD
mmetsp:Transcript_8459/g.17129  ORF Transcript_8459/g.17129 Transcript_8459/m.17129 type:complete len:200 (+) Transcript_8459:174-773(+)